MHIGHLSLGKVLTGTSFHGIKATLLATAKATAAKTATTMLFIKVGVVVSTTSIVGAAILCSYLVFRKVSTSKN